MSVRVPVEPLQRALAESDLTMYEVARQLGWFQPNSGRVSRALGLTGSSVGGRDGHYVHQTVKYDTAARIAEILGVAPRDVGL